VKADGRIAGLRKNNSHRLSVDLFPLGHLTVCRAELDSPVIKCCQGVGFFAEFASKNFQVVAPSRKGVLSLQRLGSWIKRVMQTTI